MALSGVLSFKEIWGLHAATGRHRSHLSLRSVEREAGKGWREDLWVEEAGWKGSRAACVMRSAVPGPPCAQRGQPAAEAESARRLCRGGGRKTEPRSPAHPAAPRPLWGPSLQPKIRQNEGGGARTDTRRLGQSPSDRRKSQQGPESCVHTERGPFRTCSDTDVQKTFQSHVSSVDGHRHVGAQPPQGEEKSAQGSSRRCPRHVGLWIRGFSRQKDDFRCCDHGTAHRRFRKKAREIRFTLRMETIAAMICILK